MRFLIVRLSALGDVACTLPVAGHLRQAYPDAEIVWVVDKRFAGIAECCRHIDRVVTIDQKKGGMQLAEIEPFDTAFDMQGLFKSGALLRGIKAEKKLGYHWQREGAQFFSQPVRPNPTSFHIVDQYVDVARAQTPGREFPTDFGLVAKDEDLATVREKVNGDYVVLNPGAGWITKRWPPASFARVAEWLSPQGLKAVFIGGNADVDHRAFDEVSKETDVNLVKMTGETSVRELVALIQNGKAHIGGDTGSTHIAAALGVPAVGLYSITKPKRSCPYGQVENCLYDPAGLSHIAPAQVIEVLQRVLARP